MWRIEWDDWYYNQQQSYQINNVVRNWQYLMVLYWLMWLIVMMIIDYEIWIELIWYESVDINGNMKWMIWWMNEDNNIPVIVFSNNDDELNVLLKRVSERNENKNGHI